jgi:uncharacterized protein involved in outer membrane biogenesis
MKKKWILRSIVGLAFFLVIVFVIAAFSLGTIIKHGVEKIGPSATQVDVKLKSAQVWLFASRAQLAGFVLGNPPGCRTPSSISVGSVSVSFKPASLFSDKLVVDSIRVEAPVVTWEGGLRDSNLKKIEKNLNDYTRSSSKAPRSRPPSSGPAKPARKFQVNDLVITGAKLQVNTTFSAGRTLTLSIPDVHLTDLGAGPQGVTAVEVGQLAFHAVLAAATEAVTKNVSQLGTEVLSGDKGAVKSATDNLKGLFHKGN